ncbi:MAG: SDR family oxidoreductase [bacterium]
MMIGILGASGLIGYNLFVFFKSNGIQTIGSYYSNKRDGLVKLNLFEDNFSIFNGCTHVVIAAGITNIDDCFRYKQEAYRCNVEKNIELIRYLADRKIKPIFLSSDQVFDGNKGNYDETEKTNPVNYYGDCKVQVEEFMRKNLKDYLILRLSKVYSRNLNDGGMFAEIFEKLRDGKKVTGAYNQIYNPTDVEIISMGIYHSINADLTGLYHLADKNIISRFEFAKNIAKEYNFNQCLIERIDFNSLPLLEKRALNSSLNVEKFHKTFTAV